jgi:tetratricopeptide (TPR) repeat protein
MDLSKHIQKADEAAKRRNWALAVGLYQQMLDLDPDLEAARAGLRKALDNKFEGKKGGGPLALVQGFMPLISAGICKLTKNWGGRARNLERYLALAPFDIGRCLALGESLYRSGAPNSAYVVYRHLGERLGADGRQGTHAGQAVIAWCHAGAVAHELKRLDEAMQCYEQAIAINPRDQDALRARKNLSAEGQLGGGYATAKSSRELLKDEEGQAELEKSHRIHKSTDEISADLAAAEAQLTATPDDIDALRRVGEMRAIKGDIGGALDCLEKALKAAPDDLKLLTSVTDLQVKEIRVELDKANKLGDDAKAERLEEKISGLRTGVAKKKAEVHPTDLGLRHALGVLYLEGGDLDGGIAELQKSVKDPRHRLEALLHLGRAFRAKGMHDLARGQLEKALEVAGTQHARTLELLYELGELSEADDKVADARGFYSRILEVDIGYKDVSRKLETLKG